ncbi:protein C6orf168, putative [Pediculus humanus corporis]|uniref:Protein C6orf168, putative n=1 Tax=Pediculus humanus subsp. corporis TaxID=121224 RepID=E0VW36_PEDHC|nr:protein C6orf168, putative [Pediculus humanus corporis]EEB17592.1 protein C6orf168, putative [Pediculus humanus corporis]
MESENKTVEETKEIKEEKELINDSNTKTIEEKEGKTEAEAETPVQPPKPAVHKQNFEKDVVYLYQFSRTPVIPSISPYCLKVETWLRLAGIKYENVDHKTKLRSKKGQLPFIELNGEEIADSAIIIKELAQKFEKDLDGWLTNDQKSHAHALTSMIENHFLWVVLAWRTKYPDYFVKGYKLNLQHVFGSKIPNGVLNFFFKFAVVRKMFYPQGAKKVKAQGIGVHKPEEIMKFGQDDLLALSQSLADKPFFFGDEPTTVDVVAFANLAQVYFIDKEVPYPLREYMIENCPNLVGLINRIKEKCFPDWEDICKTLDLNSPLPKPPPEEKEQDQKEKKDEKENKEKEANNDEIEKEKEDEKKEKDNDNEVEENKLKEEKKEGGGK